jgi:hypothetical protein
MVAGAGGRDQRVPEVARQATRHYPECPHNRTAEDLLAEQFFH